MSKKLLAITALCGLMVAITTADTYRFMGTGNWEDSQWQNQTLGLNNIAPPEPDDTARMNWGNGTCTLSTTTTVSILNTGVDEPGNLVIASGGYLTTTNSWSSIGNNGAVTGTLTVNTGGVADFLGHLWVGFQPNSTGQIDIYGGTVKVGAMLGAGWAGGVGHIRVHDDGVLDLFQLHGDGSSSFKNGSTLDVRGTGQVLLPGDYTSVILNYVTNGSILGNGVVGNIDIVVSTNGTTNTTIFALAAVPNVIGLDLTSATNSIVGLGYSVGDISTNYVQGAQSDDVLAQDPVGGTLVAPGTPVNVTIQEAALPFSTVVWIGDGNPTAYWNTNALVWTGDLAPVRETYNQKVVFNVDGAGEAVVTNQVAFFWLVMGDGGSAINGNFLRIADGGHLICANNSIGGSEWTAISYNEQSTLTVEEGGWFEAQNRMHVGFGASASGGDGLGHISVEGGLATVNGWVMFGRPPEVTNDVTFGGGTLTITDGGKFSCERFIFNPSNTSTLVTVVDGTLELSGNRSNELVTAMADGFLVVDPGSSYTIDQSVTTVGKTTLKAFVPGYDAWADTFLPTVIGARNDDYDNDDRSNFYEYALNGNPVDMLNLGQDPTIALNAGVLEYTHLVRNDDQSLVYSVKTKGELDGPLWTSGGTSVLGTNNVSTFYDEVVVSVAYTNDETFVILEITD